MKTHMKIRNKHVTWYNRQGSKFVTMSYKEKYKTRIQHPLIVKPIYITQYIVYQRLAHKQNMNLHIYCFQHVLSSDVYEKLIKLMYINKKTKWQADKFSYKKVIQLTKI